MIKVEEKANDMIHVEISGSGRTIRAEMIALLLHISEDDDYDMLFRDALTKLVEGRVEIIDRKEMRL